MTELTIGSRFYCGEKLLEVVEVDCVTCKNCALASFPEECKKSVCSKAERHDHKSVCFKEVASSKLKDPKSDHTLSGAASCILVIIKE